MRKPVDCQVILRFVPRYKQVPCCVICKMPDELCCCYHAEASHEANKIKPYWAQEVMDEPAYVSKRPSLWSWNYAAVALGIVIMLELGVWCMASGLQQEIDKKARELHRQNIAAERAERTAGR